MSSQDSVAWTWLDEMVKLHLFWKVMATLILQKTIYLWVGVAAHGRVRLGDEIGHKGLRAVLAARAKR